VGLDVHLGAPVSFQNVGQVAHIHGGDTFDVEPFHQVPNQCILCVVAPPCPFAIQASNSPTTVPPFAEFGLETGYFLGRLAEAIEQVPTFLEVLLAGCGSTGDEIVCAHVQRGFFRSQW
jgi:hypothetical protein